MKDDPESEKLQKELDELKEKIKASQKEVVDKSIQDICGSVPDVPKIMLRTKRMLKGHISKVNAAHYSGDYRHVVTGALDGKLIVWDTWTGNKVQVIPLRSSWVMAVAYSPTGNFVACGGMDNMCTVYDMNNRDSSGTAKVRRELMGMEGFLSCCRFLDDNTLITGSADTKIIKWDLDKATRLQEFNGHAGDVVTMSLSPDKNTFITGSVDQSIKLWDIRDGECKQTFWGHTSDVNSVCFHNSGMYFGTGSEDKTARLYDIRADQEIAVFTPPTPNSGFTSCGLSSSGRLIICGSDDFSIHIWDTLKVRHNGHASGHENRITTLAMPDNGMGIVTGSWDTTVRVWCT